MTTIRTKLDPRAVTITIAEAIPPSVEMARLFDDALAALTTPPEEPPAMTLDGILEAMRALEESVPHRTLSPFCEADIRRMKAFGPPPKYPVFDPPPHRKKRIRKKWMKRYREQVYYPDRRAYYERERFWNREVLPQGVRLIDGQFYTYDPAPLDIFDWPGPWRPWL